MSAARERKLFKDGAKALRDVFGKRAEAVAFFLAHIPSRGPGGPTPDDVEKVFKETLPGHRSRKGPSR